MEDKTNDMQESATVQESTDVSDNSYNEDSPEYTEEEIAEYEKRKKKLARTMTIFIILIFLFFGLLVLLNKHFNG